MNRILGRSKPPRPPKHLSRTMRRWWSDVNAKFILEGHHVKLLTAACEAWDTMQEARETVAREGAFYVNRFKEPRAHPGIAVERDAKAMFARLLHALNLDAPAPGEPGRPSGR